MDISPAHAAARAAAARVPALNASLARLNASPGPAAIAFFGGTRPAPGAAPPGDQLVVIPLQQPAGTVDAEAGTITLAVPIEGLVTGADPADGTLATWGRIFDGAGDWWGDCSVSSTADGTGEAQFEDPLLRNGSFARLTIAGFTG